MGGRCHLVTRFPNGQRVTRLRAPLTEDRYGDLHPDWSGDLEAVLFIVGVAPTSTSDDLAAGRTSVLGGVALYFDHPDVDVQSTDRFDLGDGHLWVVDGAVQRWRHPMTGWQAGAVVNLKRLEDG